MAFLTFRGGVHPYDGKELSKEKPITDYAPGKELVYPLSQHIGAPAKPVVKKGDHVLAGQMIAEAGGFVSAPIHASVSGTVTGIKKILNNMGSKVDAVIIENDEQYESVPDQVTESLDSLSKEEVLNKIREGGVVGMGGAGFPTHVKLSPKEPDKIEYVLVNGAECEPYLTSDYRRMMDYPDEVIGGLKCMLKLFDNAKGCICIEDNKPDCIAKMTELVKDEPRIEVKTLKTKYPQGAERCLIYAVTDREINSSMLPADAGCVVDNVDTVCAVYRAVMFGRPVTEKIVTVTGDGIANPQNFRVKIGTSFADLIEAAGGLNEPVEKVISGGPMMGFAMVTMDAPVTKTSSSILLFKEDVVAKSLETACINCGRCVEICPSRIIPSRLADFSKRKDEASFVAWNGLECVECGSCSYVCPAKRQLKQAIGSMRKTALANRKKK